MPPLKDFSKDAIIETLVPRIAEAEKQCARLVGALQQIAELDAHPGDIDDVAINAIAIAKDALISVHESYRTIREIRGN